MARQGDWGFPLVSCGPPVASMGPFRGSSIRQSSGLLIRRLGVRVSPPEPTKPSFKGGFVLCLEGPPPCPGHAQDATRSRRRLPQAARRVAEVALAKMGWVTASSIGEIPFASDFTAEPSGATQLAGPRSRPATGLATTAYGRHALKTRCACASDVLWWIGGRDLPVLGQELVNRPLGLSPDLPIPEILTPRILHRCIG